MTKINVINLNFKFDYINFNKLTKSKELYINEL